MTQAEWDRITAPPRLIPDRGRRTAAATRRRSFRCVIESNQPKKPIPPGLHGGDRRSAGARSSSQNENLKAFVTDIAVKTGKGRSTVARDVTRAKKVAVLDDIAGTCLRQRR